MSRRSDKVGARQLCWNPPLMISIRNRPCVGGIDDKVPFLFLFRTYYMISAQSKTNLKIRIATNMLWTLIKCAAPPDLLAVFCLSAYQIFPPHEGCFDLRIDPNHLINVLAEACCTTKAVIKRQYQVIFYYFTSIPISCG